MSLIQKILNEMTPAEKNEIYDAIRKEHIAEDIMDYAPTCGVVLTDKQVKYVAELYVDHAHYDCNHSYWENIESVIRESVETLQPTNNEPKNWRVAFGYERYGYIDVTAETKEKAIEAARKRMDDMSVDEMEAGTEYLPNSESIDEKCVVEFPEFASLYGQK